MKFVCVMPNLNVRLAGAPVVRFKNGSFETDDEKIVAALKRSPDYGKLFESEEDKRKRSEPDPKAVADLLSRAMKVVQEMPGAIASKVQASEESQVSPQDESSEADLKESQKPESAQLPPPPSLTEITRMKKQDLLEVCDLYGVKDVLDEDTVAILKRKLRSHLGRL